MTSRDQNTRPIVETQEPDPELVRLAVLEAFHADIPASHATAVLKK